jgi:hypothetical protein
MSGPPPAPTRLWAAASVLLPLTVALTLSRAMRWPNDFAEAHWLLDYRFGFNFADVIEFEHVRYFSHQSIQTNTMKRRTN